MLSLRKMNNKGTIIAIVLMFCTLAGFAQSDTEINKRSSLRDRIFTGGGLGAGFGQVNWVQLAPVVGYRITNEFSAGVGISYRYASYKGFTPRVVTNDFGTSIFARYNIKAPFFAQVEYEYLNYQLIKNDGSKVRKGNSAFLVGGGMSQSMGSRAFFNVTAMYNLLYKPGDSTGPYRSPFVFRAGISLGL